VRLNTAAVTEVSLKMKPASAGSPFSP